MIISCTDQSFHFSNAGQSACVHGCSRCAKRRPGRLDMIPARRMGTFPRSHAHGIFIFATNVQSERSAPCALRGPLPCQKTQGFWTRIELYMPWRGRSFIEGPRLWKKLFTHRSIEACLGVRDFHAGSWNAFAL
jgi:hypothetical protein